MSHRFRPRLNSLAYAGATVLLSLALGFPAASALAKPGRLESILDPILIFRWVPRPSPWGWVSY